MRDRRPYTGLDVKRAEKMWAEGVAIKVMAQRLGRTEASIFGLISGDRSRFPHRNHVGSKRSVSINFSAATRARIAVAARKRGCNTSSFVRVAVERELESVE